MQAGEAGSRNAAARRVPVAPVLFLEDAIDGKKIAQNANAALRCRAVPRDRRHISRTLAHCPENIELNGRNKRRGALMRLHHVKNQARIQGTINRILSLHDISPSFFFGECD